MRLRAAWAAWTCNAVRRKSRKGRTSCPAFFLAHPLSEARTPPRHPRVRCRSPATTGNTSRVAGRAGYLRHFYAVRVGMPRGSRDVLFIWIRGPDRCRIGNVHVTNGSLYKPKFWSIVGLRVRRTPVRGPRKSRNKTPPFPRNTSKPRNAGLFFAALPGGHADRRPIVAHCTGKGQLSAECEGCGIIASDRSLRTRPQPCPFMSR